MKARTVAIFGMGAVVLALTSGCGVSAKTQYINQFSADVNAALKPEADIGFVETSSTLSDAQKQTQIQNDIVDMQSAINKLKDYASTSLDANTFQDYPKAKLLSATIIADLQQAHDDDVSNLMNFVSHNYGDMTYTSDAISVLQDISYSLKQLAQNTK